MTEPDLLQKRKTQVVAAVFGVSLVIGGLLAAQHVELFANPAAMQDAVQTIRGSGLNIAYQLAVLLLCFTWLEMDSRQLGIRRPWWLNLGVVFFTSIFVPYYLYKTRPAGKRLPAIAGFFALVLACAFVSAIGATVMTYFSGNESAGGSL